MDYYLTLGVSNDASPEEIKRAYRKIALATHPDKTGGDKNAQVLFNEATIAYEIVSDPKKRADYDKEMFPSINSIKDLFESKSGKHFVDYMQTSAVRAARNGNDILRIIKVSPETLKNGGSLKIKNPHDPAQTILISLQPPYTWCCIENLGERGKRGGKNGDLYIYFISE